jgi:peptidyl-prolyl cis-trans isomerase B (cyclophilin B)
MPTLPRTLAVLLACALLAVAGCGGGDEQSNATPTPENTGGEQQTGCAKVQQPEPKNTQLRRPRRPLSPSRTYVATVKTNCGEFQITLDARNAPRTGGSFKFLADNGFYDGTTFHRIVPGFVIQGGDPKGTGAGGPGYSVVEAPPKDLAYTRGVVAMAKTEIEKPGTSGSQFFVVTGEDAMLPPDYALVGKVTSGEDVVDRIAVVPVDGNDRPIDPVVIDSVSVAPSGS